MSEAAKVTELEEMSRLLRQASELLRHAVDAGARARDSGRDARRVVDAQWEQFLADFLTHLRQKGRERGENLLAGISFARIMRGGK